MCRGAEATVMILSLWLLSHRLLSSSGVTIVPAVATPVEEDKTTESDSDTMAGSPDDAVDARTSMLSESF